MKLMRISQIWFNLARGGIFVLSLAVLLSVGLTTMARAAPPAQSPEEGKALFDANCVACHTIGGGILVGPDLLGVTGRQDRDWLIRWIVEPDAMLAEGDPIATEMLAEFNNVPMTSMGLSEDDAIDILAYLDEQGGDEEGPAADAAATPPPPSLPSGDANYGKFLFTGEVPLRNGGPSCISCHSASGVGVLGGGTLGPDLTKVAERYPDAALPAALSGLPFPTMRGVFDDKPLDEDEIAHLYSYFVGINDRPVQSMDISFIVIGVVGFIILSVLSHAIWNKRLNGVRIPLVGR